MEAATFSWESRIGFSQRTNMFMGKMKLIPKGGRSFWRFDTPKSRQRPSSRWRQSCCNPETWELGLEPRAKPSDFLWCRLQARRMKACGSPLEAGPKQVISERRLPRFRLVFAGPSLSRLCAQRTLSPSRVARVHNKRSVL